MKWALLLAATLCAAAPAADAPVPREFAAHATMDTAGRSGVLRVAVPAELLAHLQSPHLADLRIFDAEGRAVPYAFSTPPQPTEVPRPPTPVLAALPLHAAQAGVPTGPGTLQVRIEQNGQQQSVWVDLGKAGTDAPAGARRLDMALFDTRSLEEPLAGLVVRARVPANTPVRFDAATSADLAHWTPLAAQGRIFRFDGDSAPANDRLAFAAPVSLRDRYLRLDWSGQGGVAVDAIEGVLPPARPEPALPAVTLGAPTADGTNALEWSLGFATPVRRLQLATTQANALVPVRVLGRDQPSQPWRLLAHTVIYRIGTGADEGTNPPLEMAHASVRWLRVEATHGARLQGLPVTARVLFDPLELVFVAGTAGPYALAAGRTGTAGGALPPSMLAAAAKTPLADLPVARIARVESAPPPTPAWWSRSLPRGVDGRTASLWLVLAVGVLLLGGVAWSLLRQLDRKPAEPGGTGR